jgi:hypothetical protein
MVCGDFDADCHSDRKLVEISRNGRSVDPIPDRQHREAINGAAIPETAILPQAPVG